jgi:predicted CxxxxCH...CXXCH cytochrome family protein
MQYSGLAMGSAADKVAQSSGNSTAAVTGTTATTFQANELWIGGIGLTSSAFTLGTPLNAFTAVANAASTNATATSNARVYALERMVTATGAASSGGTVSATGQWSGAIATFREDTTTCTICHGGTVSFPDGTARNTPAGLFTGSHSGHVVAGAIACATCHIAPGATEHNHANGTISMASPLSGGSYVKGASFPAVNPPTAFTACNTTTCHGTTSPTWGANTTNYDCTKCHGKKVVQALYSTTNNWQSAPGYGGTGTDLGGASAATDAQVGAHDTHLRALNAISARITCVQCHTVPASASAAGHSDTAGPAEVVFSGIAVAGTGTAPSYVSATGTCSNTYCHYGRTTYATPPTANGDVVWTNTAYLTGVDTAAADCGKCHASPPLTTGTHSKSPAITIADCNGCHSHVNTNGTFNNAALHINGTVEASGGCITCHDKVQGTRSIITTEFGLAWGHKKAGRTAVTDSDCIVCHLEGDFTTQKAVDAPTGKHKDGNVDLRDPDGTGATAITDNNNNAFTFTKYAVSYAAGSRTTTLGNTVAEVITVKFCMKCHDANGATNTTARTRNATNTATTGTQYMPFEGVNLGANYTTTNGAAAAGGVVDVSTQFASTNSSRHPVGAPNSRAYPYSNRLAAPYNNIGTTRDSNTQTINTASPRVKANSVVLVCDDCHTTGTTLTTRTITAHGSATGLRGTFFVSGPTLCLACHIAGTNGAYNNTATTSPGGSHGTGSGFGPGTTRPAAALNYCNYCHFSNPNTYSAANRPRYGQDVHGFNVIYGTAAGWTQGTANGMRPIAFMRNSFISGATLQGSWASGFSPRPYTATTTGPGQFNLAAGNSQCGGSFAFAGGNSGISCSSNGHTTYTPGGSY